MSRDGSSIPAPRPTRFVEGRDAQGNATLEVVEGTLEQSYRVGGRHSEGLFLALIRSRGLLPYRHARQRQGTLCVRATLSQHDGLWSEFLELGGRLSGQLAEVTRAFLREHVEPTSR